MGYPVKKTAFFSVSPNCQVDWVLSQATKYTPRLPVCGVAAMPDYKKIVMMA
jgi:hypothetical protein